MRMRMRMRMCVSRAGSTPLIPIYSSACAVESAWSSCRPQRNVVSSSTNASSQGESRGSSTVPPSKPAVGAFIRTTLSPVDFTAFRMFRP